MAWPKAMPIVEVAWIDSQMAGGWHSVEDMRHAVEQGALECRTSGYLFCDQTDRVTIVGSQSDSEHVGDGMTIPRRAILSITTLRDVED